MLPSRRQASVSAMTLTLSAGSDRTGSLARAKNQDVELGDNFFTDDWFLRKCGKERNMYMTKKR